MKPTKKELAWCERLRKVLAAHPKSLWLFNNGEMHVMKYPKEGDAMNSECIIESFNVDVIYSEGGDW